MTETLLYVALITQLGSPSYAEREAAQVFLKGTLPTSAPACKWALGHPDAEVAARAKVVWRHHCWVRSGQLKPTKWPHVPWVDSLPHEYPQRSQVIEDYLAPTGLGPDQSNLDNPPHWPRYRQATRYLIRDLLLEGTAERDVVTLMDEMVAQEKKWIQKHKDKFSFPKEMLDAAEE